jgi:hypothetical protein
VPERALDLGPARCDGRNRVDDDHWVALAHPCRDRALGRRALDLGRSVSCCQAWISVAGFPEDRGILVSRRDHLIHAHVPEKTAGVYGHVMAKWRPSGAELLRRQLLSPISCSLPTIP